MPSTQGLRKEISVEISTDIEDEQLTNEAVRRYEGAVIKEVPHTHAVLPEHRTWFEWSKVVPVNTRSQQVRKGWLWRSLLAWENVDDKF